MDDVSEGEKAVEYNGRVYHDIATVKKSEEDKSLGQKKGVAHHGRRDSQLQEKQILHGKKRHAKGYVRFHATREVAWASDFDHSTG